jgi:hypothetical protein
MRRQRWKHPMMSNEKLLTPTDVAIVRSAMRMNRRPGAWLPTNIVDEE